MFALIKLEEHGLTLIEVLAVLVLVALLTSTVVVVYIPANMWLQQARFETAAIFYARSILENLRADKDKVNAGNQGKSADEIWADHKYKPAQLSDLTSTIDIEKRPGELSHLFNVSVTVNWTEGVKSRSLVLKTVINSKKKGLDD